MYIYTKINVVRTHEYFVNVAQVNFVHNSSTGTTWLHYSDTGYLRARYTYVGIITRHIPTWICPLAASDALRHQRSGIVEKNWRDNNYCWCDIDHDLVDWTQRIQVWFLGKRATQQGVCICYQYIWVKLSLSTCTTAPCKLTRQLRPASQATLASSCHEYHSSL